MSCKDVENGQYKAKRLSPLTYQALVTSTETTQTPVLLDTEMWRVQHGIIGISTEAGELLDALKRYLYYKREIDKTNLIEELGDVLWYIATVCNALNVDMGVVMAKNINKLHTRYKDKFTTEAALSRDLNKEREVLEEPPADLKETVAEMQEELIEDDLKEYEQAMLARIQEMLNTMKEYED